jgi:hypothetical protein
VLGWRGCRRLAQRLKPFHVVGLIDEFATAHTDDVGAGASFDVSLKCSAADTVNPRRLVYREKIHFSVSRNRKARSNVRAWWRSLNYRMSGRSDCPLSVAQIEEN